MRGHRDCDLRLPELINFVMAGIKSRLAHHHKHLTFLVPKPEPRCARLFFVYLELSLEICEPNIQQIEAVGEFQASFKSSQSRSTRHRHHDQARLLIGANCSLNIMHA